jgi:hypothetical protein
LLASIDMLKVAFADCGVGWPESVTVTAAEAVPTEFCAGVPAIAPVEVLMDNPLGRLLALN